jgi:hypothetical protein
MTDHHSLESMIARFDGPKLARCRKCWLVPHITRTSLRKGLIIRKVVGFGHDMIDYVSRGTKMITSTYLLPDFLVHLLSLLSHSITSLLMYRETCAQF